MGWIAPEDRLDMVCEERDELKAEVERLKAKLAEPLHAMVDDGLPELLRELTIRACWLEQVQGVYQAGAAKAVRGIVELFAKHGVECEEWT